MEGEQAEKFYIVVQGKLEVLMRGEQGEPLRVAVLGAGDYAAIFGMGWGISGYCPGPSLTALVLGIWNPVLFVLAAIAGSLTYKWVSS